jgi:hypothetical protein
MCELCHDKHVIWTSEGGITTIAPCPRCNLAYRAKMGYESPQMINRKTKTPSGKP